MVNILGAYLMQFLMLYISFASIRILEHKIWYLSEPKLEELI